MMGLRSTDWGSSRRIFSSETPGGNGPGL